MPRTIATPPEQLWIDTCLAYVEHRHGNAAINGDHTKAADKALDAFLQRFPEWKLEKVEECV